MWRDAQHRFQAQVAGPHFEALCRDHVLRASVDLFEAEPGDVVSGTITDPVARGQIELDGAVLAPAAPGQPRQVLALGEAKWGDGLRQEAGRDWWCSARWASPTRQRLRQPLTIQR